MMVRIIKGTNQIGGAITEISHNNTKIIIDFGEDLDNKEPFELEGLTYGTPSYDAVFITHSHRDHMGLINKIMEQIPVYVEEKTLKIYHLTCDFCGKERIKRKVNTFKLSSKNKKANTIFHNKDLKITPYLIDHSGYNSCMYKVESENKTILHTGDFRSHGRKGHLFVKTLKEIGKVNLLITEGTTLTRKNEKLIREQDIEEKALEIMKKYDQILILQSSTNIDRTVSFIKASLKTNKNFILDLFSYHLNQMINFNIKVDNKKIFVYKPIKYKNKPNWFKKRYCTVPLNSNFFPNFTMEIKESMCKDIKMLLKKGHLSNACLIYSMWDGYLKKEENLKTMLNELKKMKIDYYELHTSGHASKEAMSLLNKITNPDKTIIIHTENKELGKTIFNHVEDIKDHDTLII